MAADEILCTNIPGGEIVTLSVLYIRMKCYFLILLVCILFYRRLFMKREEKSIRKT